MKKSYVYEIDTDHLNTVSDEYLAALWHLAQFLPVEHGDRDACEIVRALGVEIIQRWMRHQPVKMFRIQSSDFLHWQLTRIARWNGAEWVVNSPVAESREPAGSPSKGA